jgi:hypothetical protein
LNWEEGLKCPALARFQIIKKKSGVRGCGGGNEFAFDSVIVGGVVMLSTTFRIFSSLPKHID